MMREPQLELDAEGFSVATARVLARASHRAYLDETFRDEYTSTSVLVEFPPDAIIVAFRGTNQLDDWITNAQWWWPQRVRCGQVHRGFWDAWCGVKEKLSRLLDDTRPFYFTGHSLGGALAQIAAKYFAGKGCLIGGVYTYGAPRLWDGVAAQSYDTLLRPATFNVVNACDPVPLLPPLLAGYRDAGREIFLPAAGGFVPDPFIGFELLYDVLGGFDSWRQRRRALLPNHAITRYIEKLDALRTA